MDAESLRTERLLTRDFLIVTASGLFALIGFSSTLPLVPRYVEGELDGSKLAVGVAVGIFSISAVASRPLVGKLGDERGRRFLIVGGCAATAVTVALHALATSIPLVYLIRLAMGATQGAFFVGTATLVNDIAPPHRRGEATNYFSVAVYAGMAFGPLLGEVVQRAAGFGWAFVAGGLSLAAAAGLGLLLPAHRPEPSEPSGAVGSGRRGVSRFLHPAAFWPGLILFCGIVTFTALNGFMPLFVEEWDLGSAGPVFVVYGLLVLVIRVAGSRLPDRWGTMRTATVALVGQALGMTIMGAWISSVGLYTGAAVLALGGSMLYPALLTAAINDVPATERARATSTFSMAFELSAGIGGPILGLAATLGGNRAAFFGAAVFAVIGLPLLYRWRAVQPHQQVGPAGASSAAG